MMGDDGEVYNVQNKSPGGDAAMIRGGLVRVVVVVVGDDEISDYDCIWLTLIKYTSKQ